jgi:hypothetical protein
MTFYRIIAAAAVLTAFLTSAQTASAEELLGSYLARISDADKEANDGFALESAAQIVRQDRANWHKYGSNDDDDQADDYLSSADARARFERMLKKPGAMDSATRNAIVNGYPLIQVSLYDNSVYVELMD